VTVHVATKSGSAPHFVVVTLMNVDNSDTFLDQQETDTTGVATFPDVPEGHYSVVAFTFFRVLVEPEFTVTGDHTIEMSLGDATVKPQETFAHHRHIETALSVARWPAQGWAFPFSFSGPRFGFRVQAQSGAVAHGRLFSGVSATFVRGHPTESYDHLAVTSDVVRGVPDDLAYVHHRRDFTRVIDRLHANAPPGSRPALVFPADGRVDLFDPADTPVPVPGRLTLLLQAGPQEWYEQMLFPQDDGQSLEGGSLLAVNRYLDPGTTHVIDWARGPVGPGLDNGPTRFNAAVRRGDRLSLWIPLFSGAGTSMDGTLAPKDGAWSLRRGHEVLAHGHRWIFRPALALPHGDHRYVLRATSHPAHWQLSTQTSDVWSFRSRSGQRGVPIIMPRYVAPQTLSNTAQPGRTAYRLSFESMAAHTARIVRARLLLSTDDGQTWRRARLTRLSPTTFRVRYRTPRAHGRVQALSVRVVGRDAHGNRVEETAIRAYRLR
jgi:hypothetical protein